MSLGEYLFFRIFGERVASVSMASASGMLRGETAEWDEKIMDICSVYSEQLSWLQTQPEGLVGMLPEFSSRWPSLTQSKWFPVLGDGACSNIGCGCSSPDRVTLMVGTSGAMRAVWDGGYRPPAPGLWCYRIDKPRPIQGGALSNGGNLFGWMSRTLNLPPIDQLETQLADIKPASHGLKLMPFLAGHRSPHWSADRAATIHGLRLATTPVEILRAGLEAIAYRFAMIHRLLQPLLPDDHIMVASGGALLRSPVWTQIMADVIGRPVCVSNVDEASCRGAALYVLEQLHEIESITKADAMLSTTFEPNLEAHEIYQKELEEHIQLEELLS
jgi:gluconokinase